MDRAGTSHAIIVAEDLTMSMPSPTDAEAFYQFLGAPLSHGERETPPERLLRKWREERELAESCAAIREGMADLEAGRVRSLEEFDQDFRQRNGLSPRSDA